MEEGISVPLPSELTGFGKENSKSSKKCYKVEAENVPSFCLSQAPMSIRIRLLSESATPCNTYLLHGAESFMSS